MYKIIGADQKEYGPITGDQIRQWIAEGRVNAHTQARAEGATEWQPLSAFAEFADAFGIGATTSTEAPILAPLQASDGRDAALRAVKGPAIALIVTAVLYALSCLWGIIRALFLHPDLSRFQQFNMDPQVQKLVQVLSGPVGAIGSLLGLVFAVFILFGAIRMLALRNHQLAFAASILAMLPCSCCCVLGLPFGIWALVVLNKPDVKSQFS
jgi:GYF domain 2